MSTKSGLRLFLAFIYAVLIALLIGQSCNDRPEPIEEQEEEQATDEEAVEQAQEIGNDGEIKITLLWNFYGDVDLHVTQPNGRELSFREMRDRSTGGELDVDNREGGRGAAENIYWTRPGRGRYRVNVVMYSMNGRSPRGGQAQVVVKNGGETRTYTVRLTRESQDVHVTDFIYDPEAAQRRRQQQSNERTDQPSDSTSVG